MCLAKVYKDAESTEPILENVANIKLHSSHAEIETLFGQKEVIEGKIVELDFVNSRVIMANKP